MRRVKVAAFHFGMAPRAADRSRGPGEESVILKVIARNAAIGA
jgi:hypothetical protein